MDTIFHEKQEGQLCAKHCLNSLLQGPYYTEIDLATIAKQIDEQEKFQMAEGGLNNREYQEFLQNPSSNMDDSGYFSVQVIESALKVWGLDLIPFSSQNEIAQKARHDPTTKKAYICNYKNHWFTIRKIGQQWFNLNSLLSGPELISDTYLSLFLTQLQSEGYSIFVVNGILPDCKSDQVLSKLKLAQTSSVRVAQPVAEASTSGENEELSRAIAMSMESNAEDEKRQLEAAIALSLQM